MQREMAGSQLGLVTVSAVEVSPDLKNARIFVTCLGGQQQANELVRTLNDMAWHYRHELARVLTLRSVPQLKFEFDVSIERGRHLSGLIDSLSKSSSSNPERNESSIESKPKLQS